MTSPTMAAVVEQVQKRAGEQEQKWEVIEDASEMSPVLHNKKVTCYQEKTDEHPFCRGLRIAIVVGTMFVCHSLFLVLKVITIDRLRLFPSMPVLKARCCRFAVAGSPHIDDDFVRTRIGHCEIVAVSDVTAERHRFEFLVLGCHARFGDAARDYGIGNACPCLGIEHGNDQVVNPFAARNAAMHASLFVVARMAAQNFGRNQPKEEFHSIQLYRLIGVDRRRLRHPKRESEGNEDRQCARPLQRGDGGCLAAAIRQHCVSM